MDQYQPRAICANLNLCIHNHPAGLLAASCLALRDLQMHEMPRGLTQAEFFLPPINCMAAVLNPVGFCIFIHADGQLCSEGNAQICIHLESCAPLTFHRGCSSLVKHLAQCGPTALVFLGVLLVLLKLGNFRGTLQPNICVVWPSTFNHIQVSLTEGLQYVSCGVSLQ